MLFGSKFDILPVRFSSFLYGKLREKDRRTYLGDRMFHLFHAKNRKKDRSSYLRDSSPYLWDSLLVLFDGLGYEKDVLVGFLNNPLPFLMGVF